MYWSIIYFRVIKSDFTYTLAMIVAGLLFMIHLVFGTELAISLPGYTYIRFFLMSGMIVLILLHKPRFGFWVSALMILLLIRFYLGNMLEREFVNYRLISFLLTGLLLIIIFIRLLMSWHKKR